LDEAMQLRTILLAALASGSIACAAVLSIDDVGYGEPPAADGGGDATFPDGEPAGDATDEAHVDGGPGHGDAAPPIPDATAQPDAPTPAVGCSDGTREAFSDIGMFPTIAACSGGWDLQGLLEGTAPACNRDAGDKSSNPNGAGCADDLCAAGWHVCTDGDDVLSHSPQGCPSFGPARADGGVFFATKQPSSNGTCGDAGTDDLFGCGSMGANVPAGACGALTVTSGNGCQFLTLPWTCGAASLDERSLALKARPEGGGVLCCKS
jgi:hypothetical protein